MSTLVGALVLAQGIWIRNRIEILPPATGSNVGVEGNSHNREPLRIGILGESTAAGCGVDTHQEGVAGAIARILSNTASRPVSWQVAGEHGATARRIRYRLLPQLEGRFDVVVLLAGANDILARRTPEQWHDDLTAIVEHLSATTHHVVIAGAPPFSSFPSLPWTLGRHLALRGQQLDRTTQQVCGESASASFVAVDMRMADETFFARDGFHPSARGYQRWAEAICDVLPPQ